MRPVGGSAVLAVLGVGEAGSCLLAGFERTAFQTFRAFDVAVAGPAGRARIEERCRALAVVCCRSAAEAVAGAELVLSLVTADRALEAAGAAAPHLRPDAFYVDGNSCAPATKRAAAALVEGRGGRFVDMAIMAPVRPAGPRTPVLLSGPQADAARPLLEALGMRPALAGPEVGRASTVKMLRSVVIKGLEALTAECLLAARRAGVEEVVLASLQASDPGFDWRARATYNLERMTVHGVRRAAEMREVAATLAALGLPDRLSRAIAAWQDEIGRLALAPGEDALEARAERILAALGRPRGPGDAS